MSIEPRIAELLRERDRLADAWMRVAAERDAAITKLAAIRAAYENAPLADISECSGAMEWMQLVADIGDILDGPTPPEPTPHD